MNDKNHMTDHTSNNALPKRKVLPHTPPPWVKEGDVYFITLCTQPRGENQLCHTELAAKLYESVCYREQLEQWWVLLFLLMPDHLHMLVRFSSDHAINKTISAWKRYTVRQLGVHWQRDYFDHRIRGNESLQQKAEYIRQNPVRAGLAAHPDEWPFVWMK